MSDNTPQTGTDVIATDEVTYSGDTVKVQLNRLVKVVGVEGSKVVFGNALPDLHLTVPDNTEEGLPARLIGQDITTCSYANVSASGTLSDEVVDLFKSASVGVSQAAGSLLITTGTTARAEYLSRSTKAWRGSWLARMKFIASQRIANQNLMFLLADKIADNVPYTILSATSVSVNIAAHPYSSANVGQGIFIGGISGAAGVPMRATIASIPDADNVVFTVAGWPATGTGTCYLFGHSHIKALANGTNASLVSYDAQRRGWASGDSNVSSATSASPGFVFQIHNTGRDILFGEMTVSSTANSNVTSRAHRIENIPDDNLDLYLYIWSFNGTAAPATTTTWSIGFWDVEKFANIPVYIAGQRMQGTANSAPVNITNSPAITGTVGLVANSQIRITQNTPATGRVVSAAGTNLSVQSASARFLQYLLVSNIHTAVVYVKLYNKGTAPVLATDVPAMTIAIQPNSTECLNFGAGGASFPAGVAMAIVLGAADTDVTATPANVVFVTLGLAI